MIVAAMAYRDDELEGDLSDREEPDEADQSWDDDPEPVACPYCGKQIVEDVAVCPHCRNFIVAEDAPSGRPWWVVVGVAVCLLVALAWALSHG
jgi:hypothetical protein